MSFEEEFRDLMAKEEESFKKYTSLVATDGDELAWRILYNAHLCGVVTEISTGGNHPDLMYPAVQLISNNMGLCRLLGISLTEFMTTLCDGKGINEMARVAHEMTHGRIYDRIAELVICNGKVALQKAEDMDLDLNNNAQGLFLAALAIYHHVTPQWLRPQLHKLWRI